MPVRIYDIAKKLSLTSVIVLARAKELGITNARVASSTLDNITAEFLEQHLPSRQKALLKLKAQEENIETFMQSLSPSDQSLVKAVVHSPEPKVRIHALAKKYRLSPALVLAIAHKLGITSVSCPNSTLHPKTAEFLDSMLPRQQGYVPKPLKPK